MPRGGLGLLAVGLLAACAPAPRRVAVAGSDTVLIFSPDLTRADTLSLEGVLGPGERVWDVQFTPDGASLWVALAGDSTAALLEVRRSDGVVLRRMPLAGGAPTLLVVLPDARAVLAATGTAGPGTLHFIPAAGAGGPDLVEPCAGPVRGGAPLTVLDELYVSCAEDAVAELDTKLRVAVRTVPLAPGNVEPRCGAGEVALSANGTIVFVLCRRSGTLLYLDRVRLTVLDSVAVGEGARGLRQKPDGRRAVVIRPEQDELVVVDFRRRGIVARLDIGGPVGAAVGSSGRWAYVATHRAVARLDLRTVAIDATAEAPSPVAVDVWPGHRSPVMRWH